MGEARQEEGSCRDPAAGEVAGVPDETGSFGIGQVQPGRQECGGVQEAGSPCSALRVPAGVGSESALRLEFLDVEGEGVDGRDAVHGGRAHAGGFIDLGLSGGSQFLGQTRGSPCGWVGGLGELPDTTGRACRVRTVDEPPRRE